MELKEGYKQTEVGVIPEDWEVKRLHEGLSEAPAYGINAPAQGYKKGLPAYIRITDITDEGAYNPPEQMYVDVQDNERFFLKNGDIILARTGASVGKSYLYKEKDGKLVYAGFLIKIHPDGITFNPTYIFYFAHSPQYWKWVAQTSIRSGQPGINGTEYAALVCPCPPLAEQKAIASALSDIDALLSSLDALIAKKRDIKTAAMQELLTGKKRLPGFSGEWVEKRLDAIGTFIKGRGISRSEAHSGLIPCIRYGEIYTHHTDIIKNFYSFISREVAQNAARLQSGDILFTCSGETKEDIGKSVAFTGSGEAYAGGDIIILRNTQECPEFLGYRLNAGDVSLQKSSAGQGDAVVHISATSLGAISVTLPQNTIEQAAIAAVLSDMDSEIAALEARRAKVLVLKQGMMQELLTGRTRLLPAGE